MPTPVNHLILAQEMIAAGRLSAAARRLLESHWGPFLLGNTAPDAQTVTGQPRYDTHFYRIPPSGETPAREAILTAHPALARPDRLTADHAVFLGGYLAHLLADEAWWRDVFDPFFGLSAPWGAWKERIFLHNVLRTHLDREDQAQLNGSAGPALATAEPRGWLPFVSDDALCAWRDLLVTQLQPGHHIRTAEVFAERMHVASELIEEALLSPQPMARIFRHATLAHLQAHRADVVRRSVDLLNEYLGGNR
jgi:hypothetical protein